MPLIPSLRAPIPAPLEDRLPTDIGMVAENGAGMRPGDTDVLNKSNFLSTFKKSLEELSLYLGTLFNKKVEIEIIKVKIPFQDSNMISQVLGYNAKRYHFYRMWRKLLPKVGINNPSRNLVHLLNKKEEKEERIKKFSIYQSYSYLPPLFSLVNLKSKFSGFNIINFKNENLNTDPIKTILTSYVSGMNVRLAGRLMTQRMRPRFTVQTKQSGSLARVKVDFTEKARYTGKNKRGAFSFTVSIGHVIKS